MPSNRLDHLSRREFLGVGAVTALAPIVMPQMLGEAGAAVEPPPLGQAPRTIQVPSLSELQRIARQHFMDLSGPELDECRQLIVGFLGSFRRLDQFAEPRLPVKYPRDGGYRPPPRENPYNAWYWKCSIGCGHRRDRRPRVGHAAKHHGRERHRPPGDQRALRPVARSAVGMMLVGRYGEDATVLRTAHAFEQLARR
jgi:hypothetical protein